MRPIHYLMALTLFAHMALFGCRMTVALYALRLGASPFQVGFAVALFGLVPVLSSVAVGRWTDRAGARAPMLAGTLLLAISALTGFAFGQLAVLFGVSLVAGAAYNLLFVAQQQLVGRIGRPEELARNLSISTMPFSLSGFISPILTGFAIDHAGESRTFLMLAVVAAAALALVWWRSDIFAAAPRQHAAARADRPRGRVLDLLRQPALARIYIVAVLSQSIWDTITAILPIYGTAHGFSASLIGAVAGTFSACTLAIRVVLPAIARRLTPWQLLILSFAGSAVAYYGIPLTASLPPLFALACLLGFSVGVAAPMLLMLIHQASPPDRVGEAIGLRVTMINSSQTAIPLVAGSMVSLLGITGMFWVFATLFLSGAWFNRDRWRPLRAGSTAGSGRSGV